MSDVTGDIDTSFMDRVHMRRRCALAQSCPTRRGRSRDRGLAASAQSICRPARLSAGANWAELAHRKCLARRFFSAAIWTPAVRKLPTRRSGGGTVMPLYQKGDVRIRYEETGSGFPLLVTPGVA